MSSRVRKHEHRESRINPSREKSGVSRERSVPRASGSNRLSPTTGGQRAMSPVEGRKSDWSDPDPYDRVDFVNPKNRPEPVEVPVEED